MIYFKTHQDLLEIKCGNFQLLLKIMQKMQMKLRHCSMRQLNKLFLISESMTRQHVRHCCKFVFLSILFTNLEQSSFQISGRLNKA